MYSRYSYRLTSQRVVQCGAVQDYYSVILSPPPRYDHTHELLEKRKANLLMILATSLAPPPKPPELEAPPTPPPKVKVSISAPFRTIVVEH